MSPPLACLKNIFKSYPDPLSKIKIPILENLNWEIEEGNFIAITGRSGSGKSTLFNLLSSLDLPDYGQLRSCCYDLTQNSEETLSVYRSREIGLIFQQHNLLEDFTALENVLIPSLIAGEEKKENALILLEQVGLADRSHHYPHQLSGGEQQRVSLARSLINSPKLLLADEPTGNLDQENAKAVQDLLINLQRRYKLTLLVVTHDQRWAETADVHYKLENHKLIKL